MEKMGHLSNITRNRISLQNWWTNKRRAYQETYDNRSSRHIWKILATMCVTTISHIFGLKGMVARGKTLPKKKEKQNTPTNFLPNVARPKFSCIILKCTKSSKWNKNKRTLYPWWITVMTASCYEAASSWSGEIIGRSKIHYYFGTKPAGLG